MIRVKSIQFLISALYTLIIVFVMIAVGFVLYNKFSDTAKQNARLNNQQIVEQVQFNIESYVRAMSGIFERVDEKVRGSGGTATPNLLEQLRTIKDTRDDIVSIGLFTQNGELITGMPSKEMRTNTKLIEQSWFTSAIENPNHLSFSLPHVQNLYQGSYTWVVSMSKGITLETNGVKQNAVLLVDVNFKTIDDLSRRVSLGKRGYVYIIEESAGNIVYHPQQQLIYAGLKYENVEQALKYTYGSYDDRTNGERRLITIKTVTNIGWKVIGVSFLDEIGTSENEFTGFILQLVGLVILFVLIVSAFMSARITKPIKLLEKSMSKVEQGNFHITIQASGYDEVGRLSRRFNFMVARLRQLMDQNVREQEAKRRSELEVLHSQIHPHFLYNTLNSVVRLAGTGNKDELITMITSLSKFFRISLSRGNNMISVQDELEHIRHYLVIQKIRYKNKFEYAIEADEDALSCRTLKLILQPIVENAIYHGIEMMADQGFIRIKASVEGDSVLFTVQDNGLGIAPGKLAGLLKAPERESEAPGGQSAGSGVGIWNVHERIRLSFGEGFGLSFESRLEEGTTVFIRIPRMTYGEGGGDHA